MGATHHTTRRDSILLVEADPEAREVTRDALARQVPGATVTALSTVAEYADVIAQNDFDIVVLDHALRDQRTIDLIHALRLKDAEPGVLVVSNTSDPRVVAAMYHAGCHKCLVKEGRWLEELGPAVRQLLRLKRLEEENRRLLAKLTEANVLLEEKNRRLDEFSATVAHDIRGPLGGIAMKIEYLLDTQGSALDERSETILRRALGSTERLTRIVQSMYEYAKLGTQAAVMAPVDLGRLVHEVVLDLHLDESRDITVAIGELPTVFGNADLLRRVFINLIGNAVKYNDKSRISIAVSFEGFEDRSLGTFARIAIADNGPGIPEHERRSIFTMFTRGAHTTADDGGCGIGLAVVQRVIELHYGRIDVQSVPGQGTTFCVSVPTDRIELPR
jgi:signal transduction histidine kinase